MKLRQRLSALETRGGRGVPHVVLWHAKQSFDECLANSTKLKDADSCSLIEMACHGGPTLTPEQLAERAKAYAWADELEAL